MCCAQLAVSASTTQRVHRVHAVAPLWVDETRYEDAVPAGTEGFVPAGTEGFVPAGTEGFVPAGTEGFVPAGTKGFVPAVTEGCCTREEEAVAPPWSLQKPTRNGQRQWKYAFIVAPT